MQRVSWETYHKKLEDTCNESRRSCMCMFPLYLVVPLSFLNCMFLLPLFISLYLYFTISFCGSGFVVKSWKSSRFRFDLSMLWTSMKYLISKYFLFSSLLLCLHLKYLWIFSVPLFWDYIESYDPYQKILKNLSIYYIYVFSISVCFVPVFTLSFFFQYFSFLPSLLIKQQCWKGEEEWKMISQNMHRETCSASEIVFLLVFFSFFFFPFFFLSSVLVALLVCKLW